MAFVLADRVKETTTTTGTGTVTLAGAVAGFQSFSAIGNSNTTYYCIAGPTEWEVGIGTYTSAGTTLARNTVIASSNAGALVTFSAGSKDVFCSLPSGAAIDKVWTTGGTSTAYTLTPVPGIPAYQQGQMYIVQFNAACGDQPTLAISGVATPPNLVYQAPDGTYTNVRTNMITANHVSRIILISTTQALVQTMPVEPSAAGFKTNVFSADFAPSFADNGSLFTHSESAAARTITIPANATVPLPVGYNLTIFNDTGASNVNIAITTDTLLWLGAGTAGTRVLGANGMATITKVSATKWAISGANVS